MHSSFKDESNCVVGFLHTHKGSQGSAADPRALLLIRSHAPANTPPRVFMYTNTIRQRGAHLAWSRTARHVRRGVSSNQSASPGLAFVPCNTEHTAAPTPGPRRFRRRRRSARTTARACNCATCVWQPRPRDARAGGGHTAVTPPPSSSPRRPRARPPPVAGVHVCSRCFNATNW